MTHFIRNGNNVTVMADGAMNVSDKLDVGLYVIRIDSFGNLFLEQIKSFVLPSKIYGDITRTSDKIINTFKCRNNNTGVLLVGEKGSGKTLLAKYVSIMCQNDGVPTILVNQQFNSEALNSIISKIDQPCVVMFDEFEKVYPCRSDSDDDNNAQEGLLTLLDGVYNTKKLFLLTCNDENSIDSHMINRPGRIFYYKTFDGLDGDFIEEYINDELKLNVDDEKFKLFKSELCYYIRLMGTVNFDMLKAIVEESNRYQSSVLEIFEMLNVGHTNDVTYDVFLKIADEQEEIELFVMRDPLNDVKGFNLCLSGSYSSEVAKIREKRHKKQLPTIFRFTPSDITKVEKDGTMYLTNTDGDVATLKKCRNVYGGYKSVGYRSGRHE